MENEKSKAFNPYFIQPVYTKKTFLEFLSETNYPTYIVVNKGHRLKEIKVTKKYFMFNFNIQSSNIIEIQNRPLDMYVKN